MRTDAVLGRREGLLPAAPLRLASDQRLVAQVRAGSERAFEALFDRHHRPVLAFCRHMLGSPEEAEDVAQLTFLAAYRDLTRTEPPLALRPWLYAIARHRCLSVLRARRERPVEKVPESTTDHLAAATATREDLRAVLADVARLPHDQRAALVLAELGDVSHEDIARILACPRMKVKALVFQARSSLTAARAAREAPCAEIREQLATLRGGALRRATLRRHLHDCPECRAFREQLRTQRRALGLLLPVAPTAWLKRAVLGAAFGSGGGAEGAAVTAGALSAGGLAAMALVALSIPAGGITAAATAFGNGGEAPPVTPAVRWAAPASALPRAGAEQAHFEPDRQHRSSAMLTRRVTQPRERPVQAQANGKGAGQAERANSPGQAEPAEPPQPATPYEAPRAKGPATPAKPVKPVKPVKPPRANGHPTPATPVKPLRANRHPTPATPATPVKPPQANGPSASAEPDRHAERPPPAAREAGPQPTVTPRPLPTVAATPGGPANASNGGNGHAPASG